MSNTSSPGAFAKALQERRRRQVRRRILALAAAGLVVLLGGLAVYLLFFSPVFAVSDVRVSGNQLLATDEVLATAQVARDKPVVTTDTDAIGARVAALPPVEAVTVERAFPNAISISVTERSLVYQRLNGESYQWMDRHGVAFHSTAAPEPGVPVAAIASDETRLLADVATVVDHLPAELRPRVASLEARAVDQITIKLSDGDTVVWGSAEQSELKAEVLAVLLEVEAEVYDVSAPGHPTTK